MAKRLKTGTSFKDPNAGSKPTSNKRQQRHVQRVKAHRQRVKVKQELLANDPAQITQPLTPRTLERETKSAVRLRYGQQEQEYAGQIRASDRASANASSWFDDYRKAVDASTQRTQQIYAQAAQEQQAYGAQASATDSANRQQVGQQMQADAAKRGATVDPSIQALGAQAEASRAAGVGGQLAATSRAGAAQGAYLADQSRIGAGRKVSALQDEAGRKRTVRQKVSQLKAEEGDYATQYKANARVTERNNQATNAALGIKAQQTELDKYKAKQDARDKADDRRRQRHNDKVNAGDKRHDNRLGDKKFNSDKEKDDYLRANHLGPYAPKSKSGGKSKTDDPHHFTGSQKRSAHADLRKWTQKVRLVRKQHPHFTEQQLKDFLNSASNSPDPIIARAAVQIAVHGGVGPKTHRRLHRAKGINVPRAKRHTQKVDPSKVFGGFSR